MLPCMSVNSGRSLSDGVLIDLSDMDLAELIGVFTADPACQTALERAASADPDCANSFQSAI